MICPSCSAEMTNTELETRLGITLAIDLCAGCKAIWFDRFEDLQMAGGDAERVRDHQRAVQR